MSFLCPFSRSNQGEETELSDSMNTGISETNKTDALPLDGKTKTVISLDKVLGISIAYELYLSLKQSLESGLMVELDASCVERVDTAALQLLCAFICDSTATGRRIQWYRPTSVLISSAKLLQIHRLLALPDEQAETTD
jgi:ABC-type transporter Mla MlaB component